jgi:hypothetical protein
MQALPQVTKLRCVHGQQLSKLATQLQQKIVRKRKRSAHMRL